MLGKFFYPTPGFKNMIPQLVCIIADNRQKNTILNSLPVMFLEGLPAVFREGLPAILLANLIS